MAGDVEVRKLAQEVKELNRTQKDLVRVLTALNVNLVEYIRRTSVPEEKTNG
jgi:hypothetical protein